MKGPPRMGEFLLKLFLPEQDREAHLGDLAEEYRRCKLAKLGALGAGFWYWRQVLAALGWTAWTRLQDWREEPGRSDSTAHAWDLDRQKGDGAVRTLWQNLRLAGRGIRRNPAFALIVVLTLSLGIGANAVVFSVVDNVVLNPFSYPEVERLVGVGPVFPKLNQPLSFFEVLSPAEYQDIEAHCETLDRVVAWDMGNRQVAGDGGPENLFSAFWWGNAFDTLQVRPAAGRGFTLQETIEGAQVAVISHRLWVRRYGSDPKTIGKVLRVNGEPYEIVGVMPSNTLIYGSDLWLPMGVDPGRFPRGRRQFQILARLAPGKTLQEANAELSALARAVELEYGAEFKEYENWRLIAHTWSRINTHRLRPAALILTGAVGFVLLLVCANMASFFLARSISRRQEIAVRTALGAGRRQIFAQLLTESTVLGLLGGSAGLGMAALGVEGVNRLLAVTPLRIVAEAAVNPRVVGFTFLLSIAAGVLFGLAPALQCSRTDIQSILKNEGAASTAGTAKQRLQSALVAAEVGLAFILLVGGGLLVHSFVRLQSVEPGFDKTNLLTMRLTLPRQKYRGEQITGFFHALIERVEAIPGVARAAAVSQFPPNAFFRRQFWIEGTEVASASQLPTAFLTLATEGTLEAMKLPLRQGRFLEETDRPGTPLAAVVNEAAARRYFPDQDPIGKRFKTGPPDSDNPFFEIVGVVGSTKNRGLDSPAQPEIFGSVRQLEGVWNQLFLMIRTEVEPRTVLAAVRQEVAALDPDQPVYAIRTVEEAFDASTSRIRIATTTLTLFALFASVLAAVGIFSVVSYRVAARTREIGLRIALGAGHREILRHVIFSSLAPVVVGAVLGLAASLALGRGMRSLLFEVSGNDPLTLGAAASVLLVIALGASFLPARRASRLDPVEALRYE